MLSHNYINLSNGVGINYYVNSDYINSDFPAQNTYVFLHGLTNNAQVWHPLMPFFSFDNSCCYYIDLPGHGNSSHADYSYDIPFYTATIRHFVEVLKLKNVSLIGHSLGGQIAINYAINYPKDVEKLILIAPAGFETFTFIEKTLIERAALFPVTLGNYLKLLRPSSKYNNYLPIEQILHDRDALTVISKSVKGMLRNTVFSDLSELNLPVLTIFGENDKAIPNTLLHPTLTTRDVAFQGAKQIRDCKLELIPQSGHFVHLQHPDTIAEKIHDFLSEVSTPIL